MPLFQLIEPYQDGMVCSLVERWRVDRELASRLVHLARITPFGLQIISGFRTKEEQEALKAQGRPTAPDHLSTHRSCPATGADLLPTIAATNTEKAELGKNARLAGLRWGGGSPIDPNTGIPSDWNHFDLGPRAQ